MNTDTKKSLFQAVLAILFVPIAVIGVMWLNSGAAAFKKGAQDAQQALEQRIADPDLRLAAQTLGLRTQNCLREELRVNFYTTGLPRTWFWQENHAGVAGGKAWSNCLRGEIVANGIGDPDRVETQRFLEYLSP